MSSSNSSRRIDLESLRVVAAERPGWATGADRMPAAGDEVYCTEGAAEVIKVLGKTGDGSRLLELRLVDRSGPPFFAAASNILVPPRAAEILR